MTDPTEVVARAPDDAVEVIEGWFMDRGYGPSRTFWEMGAEILDALAADGWAVVKLPGADGSRYEGDEGPPADRLLWSRNQGMYGVSVWDEGEVQVAYENEPGEPLSLAEARSLAAALLAAAKEAEKRA